MVYIHPWIKLSMDFFLGLPQTKNVRILILLTTFRKWHISSL